ncbi:MAM and LDL-receptor class A domain-containing protein 1-like [Vespa velutina]|uniref:MAM and LDL-receptor class A domain-containing protein 1-like n=1 Tax=Vespa velutina TaxID=202808 RepID=UPI001FB2CB87|nr:MAM and LDL-receptor class A domain-containing protein 1-like [Vespa velutina]
MQFAVLLLYYLCQCSWVMSFSLNSYTRNITTELSTYETLESEDLNKEAQHFLNPIYRDIDPSNDVERIDLQQWPGRSTVLLPRNDIPSTTNVIVPNKFLNASVSLQRNFTRYPRFSIPLSIAMIDEVFCDFGPLPSLSLCEWQNGSDSLDWMAGSGLGTNWFGGPSSDSTTNTMEGGYAFVETSQTPSKGVTSKNSGARLHSPQLGNTGVSGTCVMFKYSMDGLSVAGLRVLLHLGFDEYSIKKEPDDVISFQNFTIPFCKSAKTESERVIWHAHYYDLEMWQQAQILYTYPDVHSLIIEAVPVDSTDPSRLFRGYIAIDDIDLQPGTSCVGFCNFAGGFCDWNNDAEDDFDWTISRGSRNPATGPTMDSSSDRTTAGGYAYIDSRFPRRPGDTARLISSSFPATNSDAPICIHFWFHMFGTGIGNLKLYLRHFRDLDAVLQEIWGLSGNAGNAWYMSQITIGSLDDYQLIFEASVGNTGMGDIAIDDITFTYGACPVYPQVAATISRDCTFEVDECDWINTRDPDRVEWERVSNQVLSSRNQRKPYSNGNTGTRHNEYFLTLGKSRSGSFGGGIAQLVSREMSGSDNPLCITFWYIMFESFIDSTGPSLGVLRIYIQPNDESSAEPRPIWQLYNDQGPTWNYAQTNINERKNFNIYFEGIWGPNRANGIIGIDDISFYIGNCIVKPLAASVRSEDCSFEKGICGWENITLSTNDRSVTWQRAFLTHRPAQLLDKTFGTTGDYIFFDIYTADQKSTEVQLRSPIINTPTDEESTCFTFWFAAFGVEESTMLQIIRTSDIEDTNNGNNENGNDEILLWSLTAKGFNNPRPVWMAAQVTIDGRSPYRLILKGSASNGGFAIDDIKFQPRVCPTRPPEAHPQVYPNRM